MPEIRKGRPIERPSIENTDNYDIDRWANSANKFVDSFQSCINVGCIIPTIIIAIVLFIGLFGKDLGL